MFTTSIGRINDIYINRERERECVCVCGESLLMFLCDHDLSRESLDDDDDDASW